MTLKAFGSTAWQRASCAAAGRRVGGRGADARAPVLVVHADAHYSVARAAGILGLGTNQVLRVGLDARRRMDPQQLDEMLADLRAKGQPIVAVVACACSTPIGAFDPLDDVADVCRRHGVWLHVDAAHGGGGLPQPAAPAPGGRAGSGRQRGVGRPQDAVRAGAVRVRVLSQQAAHQFEAFRQDAPYLFDPAAPGLAEFDSGLRTVECTKRAAAFGLWGVWSLFGPQLFADLVDVTFAMGRMFYEKLAGRGRFRRRCTSRSATSSSSATCPRSSATPRANVLGRFQFELRRRLIESGEFYIVSTKIDGVGALRVTIINPLTTADHLDLLLDTLRSTGRQLLAEM